MNKSQLAERVTVMLDELHDDFNIAAETVADDESVDAAKLTAPDLKWLIAKLNRIKKIQDAIKSDERWKRFEVGRVYLTRWDCSTVPERVRLVA